RAVVTAHRNAFTNYELRDGYQGPISMIRSSDNIAIHADEAWFRNWFALTPQEVEVADIDSTHAMLIKEPHAGILAKLLLRQMNRAESEQILSNA
ncbi:MAG: hypothetical protein IAF02_12475, partial [Anaerolineae bacterium]|nr:hypothetical protein [Anaerolineae bacterium]